jgi:hypothetical protein
VRKKDEFVGLIFNGEQLIFVAHFLINRPYYLKIMSRTMTTIQLEVPDNLAGLYTKVGEKLFLQVFSESVERLIKEEKNQLEAIRKRIKVFEKKYKMKFETFEKSCPPGGDYKIHEDYGEWSHLVDVAKAYEEDIAAYTRIYGAA